MVETKYDSEDVETKINDSEENVFDFDNVVEVSSADEKFNENIYDSIPTIDATEAISDIPVVEEVVETIPDVEDTKLINNYVTDDQSFDDFFSDDDEF